MADKADYEHHNSLSRQVTVQLTSDQYERLFFQASAAKGDLSKRLGNPTLLGLLGFLIPFSCTMFCLLEFQGSNVNSLPSISGTWYFFGGIAMVLAGILDWILGNSYPCTVFIIYGVHWLQLGYTGDPAHPLSAAFGPGAEGAGNPLYTSGQAIYNIVMTLVTFIFFIGSLRTNIPFVIVFFTLLFLFGFFAAAQIKVGAGDLETAVYYFKIAGGWGFVTLLMGWYLAIITVCASVGIPCPLPIFDLSSKVFAKNEKAQLQEHAGVLHENGNGAA